MHISINGFRHPGYTSADVRTMNVEVEYMLTEYRVKGIGRASFNVDLQAATIHPIEAYLEKPYPGEITFLQVSFSV